MSILPLGIEPGGVGGGAICLKMSDATHEKAICLKMSDATHEKAICLEMSDATHEKHLGGGGESNPRPSATKAA